MGVDKLLPFRLTYVIAVRTKPATSNIKGNMGADASINFYIKHF
jgi:hypothetical protein